jgi:cupin 2 domain-containing protein
MATSLPSGSLLENVSTLGDEESFEEILSQSGVRIERIVSHGHASPEGFWYEQNDDEWVVVIDGEAELEIEGEPAPRHLERGDWVHLPARCRHRVARTAEDRPTVWLAVHVRS